MQKALLCPGELLGFLNAIAQLVFAANFEGLTIKHVFQERHLLTQLPYLREQIENALDLAGY